MCCFSSLLVPFVLYDIIMMIHSFTHTPTSTYKRVNLSVNTTSSVIDKLTPAWLVKKVYNFYYNKAMRILPTAVLFWITATTTTINLDPASHQQSRLVSAFAPPHPLLTRKSHATVATNSNFGTLLLANDNEDCGCGTETIFAGKPPVTAKTFNQRQAIRKSDSIYNVNGQSVNLDQVLSNVESPVSIVVFLRSLG
jgi:hypothetical protein